MAGLWKDAGNMLWLKSPDSEKLCGPQVDAVVFHNKRITVDNENTGNVLV